MTTVVANKETIACDLLREYFDYNPKTGSIFWSKSPCRWIVEGERAGTFVKGRYLKLVLKQKRYEGHRVAWFLSYGKWPNGYIDHINGDKTDNRLCNLREVTKAENGQNLKGPTIRNKTGYLGVTKVANTKSDRWHAAIKVNGKQVHLGNHPTPELAYEAYLKAKRIHHKGNTL